MKIHKEMDVRKMKAAEEIKRIDAEIAKERRLNS